MATGAFKATGYLGGALLILTTGIFLYAFNKLEGIDRTQSNHETRISILESKSDLRINARYKK